MRLTLGTSIEDEEGLERGGGELGVAAFGATSCEAADSGALMVLTCDAVGSGAGVGALTDSAAGVGAVAAGADSPINVRANAGRGFTLVERATVVAATGVGSGVCENGEMPTSVCA